MKTVRVLLHFVRIFGNDDFVRAESQGVLGLTRRSREQHDVSAKSIREFHAHVPKPAEADDTDFLPLADFPMAQWGISGDASAKERGCRSQVQILRHMQRKGFIHDHAVGITAVSHRARDVFIRAVVGENGAAIFAELFEAVLATFAGAAGIHHATDGGDIAFLEFFNMRAGLHDPPDDFVAGHARISGAAPFIAGGVQIGMADAAVKNLDLNIVRAGIATLKVERRERRGLGQGRKSFGIIHGFTISTAAGFFHRLIEITERQRAGEASSGAGRFACLHQDCDLTGLIMDFRTEWAMISKTKPTARKRLQPLETGQVWRMPGLNLQVGLVGKLLVHYKLAAPNAVRIANSVGGRAAVEKYLKRTRPSSPGSKYFRPKKKQPWPEPTGKIYLFQEPGHENDPAFDF